MYCPTRGVRDRNSSLLSALALETICIHTHDMNETKSCSFCTLPESRIIFGDGLSVVIRDGFPISPGHTLIIPRRHVHSFFDTTNAEKDSLVRLLAEAKVALDRELNPNGYNIGINDGIVAGQTMLHLHMHLIPRYLGDHPDPRGGVRWIIPERAKYWP